MAVDGQAYLVIVFVVEGAICVAVAQVSRVARLAASAFLSACPGLRFGL